MYVLAYPLLALVQIFHSLLFVLTLVIMATVIMSWIGADPYNPIVRTLHMITNPIYRRFSRYVPTVGPIDLTPLVVLLAIQFIDRGILPIFNQIGQQLLAQ